MSGHCWSDERCLRCGDKDWMADNECSKKNKPVKDWEEYCPICERIIKAENIEEVQSGEHDGYLFVHDDREHSDSDIEALENQIN